MGSSSSTQKQKLGAQNAFEGISMGQTESCPNNFEI